jgi:hypothetical protein
MSCVGGHLGNWLTTTSRVLVVGPTGLGKTMLGIGLGMAVAAGSGFLHWCPVRPARVLYIDGEQSRRLLKQRLADEVARLGIFARENFFAFNREDAPDMEPLDTAAGQSFIESLLQQIGGVELVIFDNVMSLISGDHKDEAGWIKTLPWIRGLTRRCIGQIWMHHTGHDESRSYGTKTREWQMDTVAHMERVEQPNTDVSFKLVFRKARERTTSNRADFTDVEIALVNDRWTSIGSVRGFKEEVSPLGEKFFDALRDATIGSGQRQHGCPAASLVEWQAECVKHGLIDAIDKPHSARTLVAKYKRELIGADWIACDETMAWTLP